VLRNRLKFTIINGSNKDAPRMVESLDGKTATTEEQIKEDEKKLDIREKPLWLHGTQLST